MSINTFGFLTFYTDILHKKLKNVMKKAITFGFKEDDKFYIGITKYHAQWAEDKNKCNITFDKTFFKLAINFFLEQCFFSVGISSFHQVGISSGFGSTLFMAKLLY